MATPNVPPTSLLTSLMAEPTPARSAGNSPITASVDGEVTSPSPLAKNNMPITIGPQYAASAPLKPMIVSPIPILARPIDTTLFVPNFSANRAAIGAVTPAPNANGKV